MLGDGSLPAWLSGLCQDGVHGWVADYAGDRRADVISATGQEASSGEGATKGREHQAHTQGLRWGHTHTCAHVRAHVHAHVWVHTREHLCTHVLWRACAGLWTGGHGQCLCGRVALGTPIAESTEEPLPGCLDGGTASARSQLSGLLDYKAGEAGPRPQARLA